MKKTLLPLLAAIGIAALAFAFPSHAQELGALGLLGFIVNKAPTFLPQTAGQKAICMIPRYALTLTRAQLRLGGTFTKAQIDRLVVRLGNHNIWDLTGSELDAINKYKGLYDDAYHLTLPFDERDASDIVGKELGGIDMSKLDENVYIDIDINAAASSPTLAARLFLTPPQGNDPDQLVKKLIKQVSPTMASGDNDINWNPKGALLQRAYLRYSGSDWCGTSATSTAWSGNTGNGAMGSITVSAAAKIGTHKIVIVEPGANVGTFIHEDPSGKLISARGVVASAYSGGGLAFTLADGATDFVSGDGFDIVVSEATNGNVNSVVVKKNGVPIWEDMSCVDARFIQQEFKKVPQTKMYVYDPIIDNNQSAAVVTADATSFMIRPTLTASDTITSIFEVLDKPYNL
jgi:hypothetical protein